MSIQCLKKKGVILHGGGSRILCKNRPGVSGKGPGGWWITPNPFCNRQGQNNIYYSATGFSINGGHRNLGCIGKPKRQIGTPFRGAFPIGYGGTNGSYRQAPPFYNSTKTGTELQESQSRFIKPSSTHTKTMMEKKSFVLYHGQYPNKWVQPTYPNGTLHENASMSSYIDKLKSECSKGAVAAEAVGYNCCNNGGYTKVIKQQPVDSSTYQENIQKRCLNPEGSSKPFPFHINNNPGNSSSKSSSSNRIPPVFESIVYYKAPSWYN